MKTKISFALMILATAIIGIACNEIKYTGTISNKNLDKESLIDSFEDCAKAGYPVMESHPRQCKTPDGKTFVEKTQMLETAIHTKKGELKLSYSNGIAKLSGTLMRSTPCVDWQVSFGETSNSHPPKSVEFNIFDKNKKKDVYCIQVLGEPQQISEVVPASEETSYVVKLEDEVVFSGKLI